MSFIGIISDTKIFENIKIKLTENMKHKNWNIILINEKSIENVKNIKFEIIIIDGNIKKLKEKEMILQQLCQKASYVLINTDINKGFAEGKKIITYGLNQNAAVTISSITDTDILIFIQKRLETKQGEQLELEEKRLKINEKCKLKINEILILYIISLLNEKNIIDEI